VWGQDTLTFLFLLRMFPCGFDLVFWNQFSVGRICALPFPHLHVPLGFLSCVFWNQFSVGSGSARSFPFPLARVPLGF
jgi:hypothetical protein